MKAILVIDLEANELPKDAYANIYVFGKKEQENRFLEFVGRCPLKSIPSKKKEEPVGGLFIKGWNACLEEIENG